MLHGLIMANYKIQYCEPSDSILEEVIKFLYSNHPNRLNQKDSIQFDYVHKCLVLLKDEQAIGRVIIYYNPELRYNNLKSVCIGNYECEDNELSSKHLLDKAIEECKSLNAEYIIGPMNGSTWFDYRFRLDDTIANFTTETYHFPYYITQFEKYGFLPIASYISAKDNQLNTENETVFKRKAYFKEQGVVIRNIEIENFETEMKQIFDFCIKAFKNNFLFTNISFNDFYNKYEPIKHLFNPEHILIAEDNEGIAGILFCINNFNNKDNKELIVKTLAAKEGIRYAGLGKVLLYEVMANIKQSYNSIIHAFIIEGGTSENVSKNLSGEIIQRYALYGFKPNPSSNPKVESDKNNSSTNITHHFFETSSKFPNKKAIQYLDEHITFESLRVNVENYSAYLHKKGIEKGDRILVFMPMSIDLYKIVLAIFNIGATAVFLDEWVSIKRLQLCCNIADCKGIVASKKLLFLGNIFKEIRKIPIKLATRTSVIATENYSAPVSAEDTALITFTTGSSGIPKAANRTHQFLSSQYEVLKEHTNANSNNIELTTLPIVLLMNLGIGSTSIIADFNQKKPNKLNPENIIKQIEKFGINKITASPYFLEKIANYINHEKIELPNIQQVFTGGAPVFPNIAKTIIKAFKNASVDIIYGSTESEPISSVKAESLTSQNIISDGGLLVGRADKNTKVAIIPIDANPITLLNKTIKDIEVSTGTIGEIAVSGRHVLKNYFKNEGAFKRNKIDDNGIIWHRTGDSGFVDANGMLYLTGPCSNLIIKNNKILSPFIVEFMISQLDGFRCGTIIENNKFTAIVEIADKQKPKAVIFKMLKEIIPELEDIIIVKHIPRDPRHYSKIDYQKLKNQIQ